MPVVNFVFLGLLSYFLSIVVIILALHFASLLSCSGIFYYVFVQLTRVTAWLIPQ